MSDSALLTPRTPPPPERGPRFFSRETGIALLFILPALFGYVVFYAWPAVRGFYYSLTDSNLLAPPNFVGLDNYRTMFGDELFWNSLKVTAEYVIINITFQTILALAIAVLMSRLTRSLVIRGIMLFPFLIPNVVVAVLFLWILDYELGVGSTMLDWIGVGRIPFFGDENWSIPAIALINVWRHVGYTALLLFAGLMAIPRDVYEAAEIDGASEMTIFRRVTLPLLRPVLALVLVITVVGSFQIFDTVAVTTQGGPVNATRVINWYIYERAFEQFDFGYASAMAVALFVILFAISLAQLKMMRASESDLD